MHTSIGPKPQALHDSVKGDQLAHINGCLIWQGVVGRIEVDDRHLAAQQLQVLLHAIAVGGLPAAWWTNHQLPEGHREVDGMLSGPHAVE